MDRGSEQTFFQRRYTDGEQVHEKILNITNYQGNANQITMRYHLTPVRMAIIKVLVRMWRKGNTYTLLVGM